MENMQTIRLGNRRLFVSRPFQDRPELILIVTDDGRRAVLGDGPEPFALDNAISDTSHDAGTKKVVGQGGPF